MKPTDNHVDRLPPHSLESEKGVLGCCLLNPVTCVGRCISDLDSSGSEFFDLRHRTLYSTMVEMINENEPVDVITLHGRLNDKKVLENIGGDQFISELLNSTPSFENLPAYLDVVKEKYALREMLKACTESAARIHGGDGSAEELLDEAERLVMAVRRLRGHTDRPGARELVARAIDRIELIWKRGDSVDGLRTGFTDYDKLTGGLHPDEVTVIAAYPGRGKTSLAMNIAEHVVIEQGLPVGVFSLEMGAELLMTRMICSRARVNLRNVAHGFLADREFPKLTSAAGRLAKSNIHLHAASDLTCYQFRAEARRMVHEHGVKLFVLDYLQLMSAPGRKFENSREQEVSEIAKVVKATSGELGVPILTMSQLNDDGKLRESRAIGQHFDTIVVLESEARDDEIEDGMDCIPCVLKIKKQRNGPRGKVRLVFLPAYTRFESASKMS